MSKRNQMHNHRFSSGFSPNKRSRYEPQDYGGEYRGRHQQQQQHHLGGPPQGSDQQPHFSQHNERGFGRYASFERPDYHSRPGSMQFNESSSIAHSHMGEYHNQGMHPRIWSGNSNTMPSPSSFSPSVRMSMPGDYSHQYRHDQTSHGGKYDDTAFKFPPNYSNQRPQHSRISDVSDHHLRNNPPPYHSETPMVSSKPPLHMQSSTYSMPNRDQAFAAAYSRSPRKPFPQHNTLRQPYPKLSSPPSTSPRMPVKAENTIAIPPAQLGDYVVKSDKEVTEKINDPRLETVKNMPDSKESLLAMMDRVDQDIAKLEEEIEELKTSENEFKKRLEEVTNDIAQNKEEKDDDQIPESLQDIIKEKEKPIDKAAIMAEKLGLDNYELIKKIYDENKAKAAHSSQKFMQLNFNNASLTTVPLYNQPSDLVLYHRNIRRHKVFRHKLIKCLRNQKIKEINAQKQNQLWFDKEHQTWQKRVDKLENNPRRKARMLKLRGYHEREFPEIKKQREQQERLSRFGSRKGWPGAFARSEAELEEIVDNLSEMEASEKQMYLLAVEPPQLLSKLERRVKYTNHNGLIRDVPLFELNRKSAIVWSSKEKEIYHARFSQQPKNFMFISNALENKSVSDCVIYYYLNKKKSNFKSLLRKSMKKRKIQKQFHSSASDGSSKHRLKEKHFETYDENETGGDEEVDGNESTTSGPAADDGDVSISSSIADEATPSISTNDCLSPITTNVVPSSSSTPDTALLSPLGSDSSLSVEELISRHLAKKSDHVDPSRWSETEMAKAVEGLKRFGRNWAAVSLLVHTKSEAQCKNFYSNYKRKFNLESILGKTNQQQDTQEAIDQIKTSDTSTEVSSSVNQADLIKHKGFVMPEGSMPQLVSTKRSSARSQQQRSKEPLHLASLSGNIPSALQQSQTHPFPVHSVSSHSIGKPPEHLTPTDNQTPEEDCLPPPPPLRAPNNSITCITKSVIQSASSSRMQEINLQSEVQTFKIALDATLQTQADIRHRNSPLTIQQYHQEDIGHSSTPSNLPPMYQPHMYQAWQFRNTAANVNRPPAAPTDFNRVVSDGSRRLHSGLSLSPRGPDAGQFSRPPMMNDYEQYGMFHHSAFPHAAHLMPSTQRLRTVSEIHERAAIVPELHHSRPSSAPSPMNNLSPGETNARSASKHQARTPYQLNTFPKDESRLDRIDSQVSHNSRAGIVSGIAPRQSSITSITGNAPPSQPKHVKEQMPQPRQMFRPWDGSNAAVKSNTLTRLQSTRSVSDLSSHRSRMSYTPPVDIHIGSIDYNLEGSSKSKSTPSEVVDRSDSETLSADENYQYSSSDEDWPTPNVPKLSSSEITHTAEFTGVLTTPVISGSINSHPVSNPSLLVTVPHSQSPIAVVTEISPVVSPYVPHSSSKTTSTPEIDHVVGHPVKDSKIDVNLECQEGTQVMNKKYELPTSVTLPMKAGSISPDHVSHGHKVEENNKFQSEVLRVEQKDDSQLKRDESKLDDKSHLQHDEPHSETQKLQPTDERTLETQNVEQSNKCQSQTLNSVQTIKYVSESQRIELINNALLSTQKTEQTSVDNELQTEKALQHFECKHERDDLGQRDENGSKAIQVVKTVEFKSAPEQVDPNILSKPQVIEQMDEIGSKTPQDEGNIECKSGSQRIGSIVLLETIETKGKKEDESKLQENERNEQNVECKSEPETKNFQPSIVPETQKDEQSCQGESEIQVAEENVSCNLETRKNESNIMLQVQAIKQEHKSESRAQAGQNDESRLIIQNVEQTTHHPSDLQNVEHGNEQSIAKDDELNVNIVDPELQLESQTSHQNNESIPTDGNNIISETVSQDTGRISPEANNSVYNMIPISPPESPKKTCLTPDSPLAESSVSSPVPSLSIGQCITTSYPMSAFPYSSLSLNIRQTTSSTIAQQDLQLPNLLPGTDTGEQHPQNVYKEDDQVLDNNSKVESNVNNGSIESDPIRTTNEECLLKYEPLSDNENEN